MGFLIWIVAGSTILYLSMVDDCEDFSSKVFVSIIYFSIFVAITLFVKSNAVCNIHMKAYEEGKLEKVYTVKGTNTTYKWVYHENS
jgi:hypothetical protein